MTQLFDILDRAEFDRALTDKHVKVTAHPTLPYLILNYTDAVTWDQAWTPTTLTCRGLVVHADTYDVIARPVRKFFNHDQPQAPQIDLDDRVLVMDKADGSLGILYPTPDGHAVATRGSFTSDQALWATAHYQERYAGDFTPNPDWTYLFEIIYPDNRVVVDYKGREALVLLGAVHNASGASIELLEAAQGWPGPIVDVLPYRSIRQALDAPETDNAEGFVLWHPVTDARIKVKFAEFKRLHKLLTGINPRHIWEILAAGQNPVEAFASAPDEFHTWMRGIITDLETAYAAERARLRAVHANLTATLPAGFTRRDFAALAAPHPDKAALFLLLDGKPLEELIWKGLRPSGATTVRLVSSEAD